MLRRLGIIAMIGCLVGAFAPRGDAFTIASTAILRPIFAQLLGNPPLMRLDVIPDLYEGGYAKVGIYAEGADIKGMHIDQIWIRLVGASFDPAALQQGTLKVLGVRDSAVYGEVKLDSVEAFLNRQGAVSNVRLTLDGNAVTAVGTILYKHVPTRVRMQGVFQVYGAPEVFFHLRGLYVNSLPVPVFLMDKLERQMNPVIDFRTWPVPFPIRSFRQTRDGFILSSETDYSQPCDACGGAPLQLRP